MRKVCVHVGAFHQPRIYQLIFKDMLLSFSHYTSKVQVNNFYNENLFIQVTIINVNQINLVLKAQLRIVINTYSVHGSNNYGLVNNKWFTLVKKVIHNPHHKYR